MTATMKATLLNALKSGKLLRQNLGSAERIFLERWAEGWADDPIWAKIVGAARELGCWPEKTLNSQLIWYALDARRVAQSVKAGFDPILEEERRERAELLALADKADDLARFRRRRRR